MEMEIESVYKLTIGWNDDVELTREELVQLRDLINQTLGE